MQDLLVQHVEIEFPDQGSNPGPLHWEQSLSHLTSREVPGLQHILLEGHNSTHTHYPKEVGLVVSDPGDEERWQTMWRES